MLAFVDESGDTGRRTSEGSSKFFTVALVVFKSDEAALECDQRISSLRVQLSLPSTYEFHFAHNSTRIKTEFLTAIAPYSFSYHAFALNKDQLYSPGFDKKESLYKFTARMVFENASAILNQATVVIDESGERQFRKELAAYLKRRITGIDGHVLIKKVKMQRSAGNNLLQVADYMAGISNRVLLGGKDAITLHRIIACHEASIRKWPL